MNQSEALLGRKVCPPGACECDLDNLLSDPQGDKRILRLTKSEEKKLIEHIQSISTYAQLKKLEERLYAQLNIVVKVAQRSSEVRTARGIGVEVEPLMGLCKKTRQAIVTAIRRCLDQNTEIVFAILDANDLFGSD